MRDDRCVILSAPMQRRSGGLPSNPEPNAPVIYLTSNSTSSFVSSAMKSRRDFIKTGLALGATFFARSRRGLLAAEAPPPGTRPPPPLRSPPRPRSVLVAVRDGSRVGDARQGAGRARRHRGVRQARPDGPHQAQHRLGRAAGARRQHPPELVGHLVKLCLAAGAKSVSIFDNPCDQWQRTYANSGIEKAARDAGAIVVNGKDKSLYREVAIPGGVRLKHARVHGLVLDSDVFINVPVLKHHSGSLMTAAMKNLMGVVWDRGAYHRNDLHQTIADFLTFKKPDSQHPRRLSPDVEQRSARHLR